ncbi:MAG: energy transducer TonB [Parvibaculum sp.]
MSMTATAYGRMTEESAGSSALLWNHRALRMPVAVSLLIHATVFAGALYWWQADGAPAPRGIPQGLSVTFIELSDPSPAPAAPQVKAAPVEQPKPQIQPPLEMQKPVVEKVPEPVVPVRSEVALDTKPQPRPEPARLAQQRDAAPAKPQQLASLAPAALHTGTGQGAPRGFRKTDGEETEEVFITKPRFRDTPLPYPRRARDLGQEGTAMIRVKIDPRGLPAEVRLLESSGYALLDHAAVQAVGRWQFEPERRGGRPISGWADIPVRYVLN